MGSQHHAGLRLAAVALFLVVVLANLDRIERQTVGEPPIDRIDIGAVRLAAPTSGWLVTTISKKPFLFNTSSAARAPSVMTNSWEVTRRIGLAVANNRVVEHSVAIEKDRGSHRPHHQHVPSHFVCPILRSGRVTIREVDPENRTSGQGRSLLHERRIPIEPY
jgi:hypothetical protein